MKDHYTLANIKKIKWGVLEPNQPIHLYPIMYPGWCGAIKGTGKHLGKFQKNILCLHIKDKGLIFVDHKEWSVLGQYALKKVVNNPQWGINLNKKILKNSNGLVDFTTNKIFKVNLKKKTNLELHKLYEEYLVWQSKVYNCALLPVYLDLYKPHLTSYLTDYLYKKIKRYSYNKVAKECFALLTVPDKLSKIQLEDIVLLKIASKIKKEIKRRKFSKNNLPKKTITKVNQHISKFKYMGYNWEGPAFLDNYYWRRLKEEVNDKIKPEEKIKKIYQEKRQAKRFHDKLIDDLKIDKKHQKLFDVTQDFIYSKEYRKMSLVQSYYEIDSLLKEISKRLRLSMAELRNCLLDEVKQMLQGKLKKPKDLSKRMKGFFIAVINGCLPGRVIVDERFAIMKKKLLKRENLSEVNYFHGQTACLGKVQGTVKIINTTKELPKMKKGNILVSNMTNPDLVPAMKKAAAIVTDLGGVTCHAAIVSRELKIPCIIGTKVATKVLKDGDKVMVDANRGEIKKI